MAQLRKIMIVDEDAGVRHSLEEVLKGDYTVVGLASGEELLSRLKDEKPDLIILDLSSAESQGLELISRIKSINSSLPIIAVSALDNLKTVVSAMRLGANDYLDKPLDLQKLKFIIKDIFYKNDPYSLISPVLQTTVKSKVEDSLREGRTLDSALTTFGSSLSS